MTQILSIGQIVIDQITKINRFPQNGEKIKPQVTQQDLGGSACSVAVFLAKMGLQSTLIASLGRDELGHTSVKKLKKLGVKLIPQWTQHTTINQVFIDRTTGKRTIIHDNRKQPSIQTIPQYLLEKSDFIFCDRHEPQAFQSILKQKNCRQKIVIDPSCEVSVKTLLMLKKADFPIVPIEFVKKMDDENGLKKIRQLIQKDFWVTLGSDGCLMQTKIGRIIKLPGFKIKAVDTLGAGEVFRGAFIYGLTQKWPMTKIMQFSNAAGALQCTKPGNINALPNKKEVLSCL
jgi:sulfofructose kinase